MAIYVLKQPSKRKTKEETSRIAPLPNSHPYYQNESLTDNHSKSGYQLQ